MTKCIECGKQIKFIHSKKDGRNIPVNVTSLYFVPPNGIDDEETFINASGSEVKGCRAPDGMTGYKRHECE